MITFSHTKTSYTNFTNHSYRKLLIIPVKDIDPGVI